ncbi:lytic transglycosylase domain-containing protein [Bacillus sp. FJAT-49732]|uniref:Lytic transglycosylase domain-containing protein n=1 Tax=Lederbergia citrisecunda TaxID=2833583 RepID=A0A942TL68_9BACI|nr:lytic transglycosylase domain-containing protein [Lederbergia citrisecunda]MBS4198687.1 lytic transglycosylase domain-containing protein [Lederbergia citrisecunda]
MNILGQLKTVLDIQLLKGFSGERNDSSLNEEDHSFAQLLQHTLMNNINNSSQQSIDKNTLGAVYNMQLNKLPVFFGKNAIQIASEINATEKDNATIPDNLEAIIQKASEVYNLPAKLIKSIIKHESNFNSTAVSHAGASGLMQLMPQTAKGLGVNDIFDPLQNVMGGSKYLRNMLDKYDGNLVLALAAYNAGPGNVDKYGGIPPFKETQNYVRKVTDTFYS